MKVVAYDPFVSAERFRELGVESATFDEVLARADFLTLHLPLTDDTRSAIDADAIAKMRDGVRIVNAARGELVDEAALVAALESGKVAGAAIDVFVPRAVRRAAAARRRTSSSRRISPRRPRRRRTAPGVIVAEQVAAALEGGLVTNAVNIPTVGAEDLEVLGPYIPLAAKLGRLAMELAGGDVRRIAIEVYGELAELRHPAADRRGAERRVPGTHRPARQLRQRAGRRRRPRDRGRRGEAPLVARLHEPRRRRRPTACASRARRSAPTTATSSCRALGFELEMELAAAHGAAALRRHPRRDRPGRDAVRRGRREHREHGRLAEPRGRQGADGALDRLAARRRSCSSSCARAWTTPT